MNWSLLSIALAACVALASAAFHSTEGDNALQYEGAESVEMPLLKLPYGTWRASSYDQNSKVWALLFFQYQNQT